MVRAAKTQPKRAGTSSAGDASTMAAPPKRRRKDAKGSDGATASAPVAVVTRPAATSCLMCHAEPSTKPWYYTRRGDSTAPLDNKCMECYESYLLSWTHRGSWNEVCALCRDDEQTLAAFQSSVAVKSGQQQPGFFQEEVDRATTHELCATKQLIGLSYEEFRLKFGHNPEALGIKTTELLNMNNKVYRGVLMQDPDFVGIRYSYNRKVAVNRMQPKMPQERHLYATQGSEIWNFEVEQQEKANMLYTKFRTCNLTEEQIRQAALEKDKENPAIRFSQQVRINRSSGSAAAAGDISADDDDGEEFEVATAVSAPPMVNAAAAVLPRASALVEAMAGIGSSSAAGTMVAGSPLAKSLSGRETASPATEKKGDTPQEPSVFGVGSNMCGSNL